LSESCPLAGRARRRALLKEAPGPSSQPSIKPSGLHNLCNENSIHRWSHPPAYPRLGPRYKAEHRPTGTLPAGTARAIDGQDRTHDQSFPHSGWSPVCCSLSTDATPAAAALTPHTHLVAAARIFRVLRRRRRRCRELGQGRRGASPGAAVPDVADGLGAHL
jgi:hypothetical protein